MHFVGKRIPTKYVREDLSRYRHFTAALRLVVNFFCKMIVSAALMKIRQTEGDNRGFFIIIFYWHSSKIFKFETFPLHGHKNKLESLETVSKNNEFGKKNLHKTLRSWRKAIKIHQNWSWVVRFCGKVLRLFGSNKFDLWIVWILFYFLLKILEGTYSAENC